MQALRTVSHCMLRSVFIAATWGIFVWHEFTGAPKLAWRSLQWMFALYIAAIGLLALAYTG